MCHADSRVFTEQGRGEGLTLGPALEELKTFAADLPFDMRGLAIENAEKYELLIMRSQGPSRSWVMIEATKDDDVFTYPCAVRR